MGMKTEKGLRTSQRSREFTETYHLLSEHYLVGNDSAIARHQSNRTWRSTTLTAQPTRSHSLCCLQNGGYERDSDLATSVSGCVCGLGLIPWTPNPSPSTPCCSAQASLYRYPTASELTLLSPSHLCLANSASPGLAFYLPSIETHTAKYLGCKSSLG